MKRYKKHMIILLVILSLAALAGILAASHPALGRAPRGERLERVRRSPHYRDGQFHNLHATPQITSKKGFLITLWEFAVGRNPRRTPAAEIPAVESDLHALDPGVEAFYWLGHSSYFIQTGGRRMLVDPVLSSGLPMSLIAKPFPGTDIYTPDDMPAIDYLLITHDHFDHLDYSTVRALRDRVGRVICPLGVGEHLERWGYDPGRITEMDWNDTLPADGITFHCLPARHFSGRGLRRNNTLWASFLLETPSGNIYLAGDGGYDTHFAEIGRRFAPVALAVMENGQYNVDWRYIHLLPEDLRQAVRDLAPRQVFTGHNSKFALAKHPWDEPMRLAGAAAREEGFDLLTPRIGERVSPGDTTQTFTSWWEEVPGAERTL